MSESDIKKMMRDGNVTREYAIRILRAIEGEPYITLGNRIITKTEYDNYLNGPIDPRD